jgi:hypothetical protein
MTTATAVPVPPCYVGSEVSKAHLDLALHGPGRAGRQSP